MLIDTHCHLTAPDLRGRLDDVVARARDSGVPRMITIAEDVSDAQGALDILRDRPGLFLTLGIHPHRAARCRPADLEAIASLARGEGPAAGLADRIVAIGETGLDFHYNFAPPEQQEAVFRAHLELAEALDRPVVIHARQSEPRVCEILAERPRLSGRLVFHCFSGDSRVARTALDLGCHLSFTGVVTFRKKSDIIRASARLAPLDRIMVETDAPYLSPEPVRHVSPCEPALVVHTARFLAELRGEEFDRFAAATTANAERFFRLPEDKK